MTIKNLKALIEKCPQAQHKIPLRKFSGRAIAIDTSCWVYANKGVIQSSIIKSMSNIVDEEVDQHLVRKGLYQQFKNYINKFLNYGITPICIFDGIPPEKKKLVQEKRGNIRQERRDKIKSYKELLLSQDPLNRDPHIIEKLRKEMCNDCRPNSGDFDDLKFILSSVGIPWFQANQEAEQLCSVLARRYRAAAVYSTDTDNIAHRCPYWIRSMEHNILNPDTGEKETYINFINYQELIEGLGVTPDQLTEICILAGCDYNVNIKNRGVLKAYDAIKKYGCYANLPAEWHDECLNFEYCWQQFQQNDFNEMTEGDTKDLCVKMETLSESREVLSQYNLESWINQLNHIYQYLPTPQIGYTFNPTAKPIKIKIGTNVINTSQSKSAPVIPAYNKPIIKQVPVKSSVNLQDNVEWMQKMANVDYASSSSEQKSVDKELAQDMQDFIIL